MAGTSSANFLCEVDGVVAFEASEADGFGKSHDPFEIAVGNRELPILGRGKSKTEEVTLKGAFALTSAGREFHDMFQDYSRGLNVQKPTVRVIQLDEAGFSPAAIHECIECVPTGFKPMGNKADSKDAAMFEVKFRPTDYECITEG